MRVNEDAERGILSQTASAQKSIGGNAVDLADNQAVRSMCGGVTRQTLLNWRERQDFPAPLKFPYVSVDLWDRHDVQAWLDRQSQE